jgi:hypothetical protein
MLARSNRQINDAAKLVPVSFVIAQLHRRAEAQGTPRSLELNSLVSESDQFASGEPMGFSPRAPCAQNMDCSARRLPKMKPNLLR